MRIRPVVILVAVVLTVTACEDGDTATSSTVTEPLTTTTTLVSTVAPTTTSSTTTTTEASTTTTTRVALPMLEVTDPEDGAVVATPVYTFRGVTDPGCTVSVGDRYHADVDSEGNWSLDLKLRQGDNATTFVATDATGNTTKTRLTVNHKPERATPSMPCDVDVETGRQYCGGWGDIVEVDLDRSEIVFDLYRYVSTGEEEYEFEYVNENPLLRRLPVAATVDIRACAPEPGTAQPGPGCGSPDDFETWSFADLAEFVAAGAERWNVTTQDSVVTHIEQWWWP